MPGSNVLQSRTHRGFVRSAVLASGLGVVATTLATIHAARFMERAYGERSPLLLISVSVAGLSLTALVLLVMRTRQLRHEDAERLAEQRTGELSAAQERFRRMVDQAPDATVVVSREGMIELASRRVEDLTGHAPSALVGKPVEVLIPKVLRAAHRDHRRGFIDQPHAREMGASMELMALHADGHQIPVEVSLSPVTTTDGTVTVIAALRDVTIRREARLALTTALERQETATRELARTDALRTRFLETVSHELRTPLTAIVGFTDLLLTLDGLTETRRREMLERIDRNAQHLTGLITDLLESTRLDRDAIDLEPIPTDLVTLVEDVTSQLATVLSDHVVTIDAASDVTVLADPRAVVRVITNLLTNAARYSPAASTIGIHLEATDSTGILRVCDEGPGISPEERDLIFERFYRGRDRVVMSTPGSGVGLSVVRHLLRLQHGTVAIHECSAPGACFEVRLPAAAMSDLNPANTAGDNGGQAPSEITTTSSTSV